jgi:hypothetical protein
MRQVTKISLDELKDMSEKMYGQLVKAVVDIKNKKVVVDAEMHVDEEQYLLNEGSNQEDLWGINLHPDKYNTDDFIEFDSMINIRPRAKNYSRGVENADIQKQIRNIIGEVVHE